jgi:membrane protease YdiL (CAAX protease family)
MDPEDIVRGGGPLVLAALASWLVDYLTARRGLRPPGFATPWRRVAAMTALAGIFYIGVFAPLATFGMGLETNYEAVHPVQLFGLHSLLLSTLIVWYALGFVAVPGADGARRRWISQFGLRTPRPGWEIGIGVLAGFAAWAFVISALLAVAGLLYLTGGEGALPKSPPAAIPWIAGQPLLLKVALALSAGFVEELFFRGFLQPRIGISLSTLFFAMAHLSYDQPFMLVGVTVLSLLFAFIVRWRQNVWSAAAAHAVFDGVQLLVVVPMALRFLPTPAA